MSETSSASTSAPTQGTVKPSAANLPMQEISGEVLVEKYAKGDEQTVAEVRRRVARALAAIESEDRRAHWESRFLEAQEKGFVPAGRINSAAGTTLAATLINCFVQPVGDSVTEAVDGRPGIYTALAQAAETMRRGGGVGYDFSSIRPKGALRPWPCSQSCTKLAKIGMATPRPTEPVEKSTSSPSLVRLG